MPPHRGRTRRAGRVGPDADRGTACSRMSPSSASRRAQTAAGHEAMPIGIAQFRDPGELRLDRMLTQPLHDDDGRAYPLGRREPAS